MDFSTREEFEASIPRTVVGDLPDEVTVDWISAALINGVDELHRMTEGKADWRTLVVAVLPATEVTPSKFFIKVQSTPEPHVCEPPAVIAGAVWTCRCQASFTGIPDPSGGLVWARVLSTVGPRP